MLGTRAVLSIVLLVCGTVLQSAERVLHANKQPKVVDLRADDVTTIMGYRAELEGELTHPPMPEPYPYKEALVFGFRTSDDVMSWTVRAPRKANYVVSLVYSGDDEVLDGCEVELARGESRLRMKPQLHDWEGKPFFIRHFFEGGLPLVKGENRISLRLSKIPPNQARSTAADREQAKKRLLRTQGFGVWSIELGTADARKRQLERSRKLRSDNSWMVEGKYGLFIHWSTHALPLYGDKPRHQWHEKSVEIFDVDAFAGAVQETGAAWVCLTATHGEQYWPGPSKVIDRILPGRTASRDLIADLAAALSERGIRLVLYYHWCLHSAHHKAWARAAGAWDDDPRRWFD
ncbi:MAG: hypothetical protein GY953_07995, partial [bacterium]|nr:hypothetical protein [bacterium]